MNTASAEVPPAADASAIDLQGRSISPSTVTCAYQVIIGFDACCASAHNE